MDITKSPYTLTGTHTFSGTWRSPKSDTVVFGVVEYRPDTCTGELHENIPTTTRIGTYGTHDFLHGESQNPLTRITALGVFEDYNRKRVHIDTLLVGEHIDRPHESMFSECEIDFPSLTPWMGYEDLDIPMDAYQVSVTFDDKARLYASWSEGKIESAVYGGQRTTGFARREVFYKHTLKIIPTQAKTLGWFERIIEQVSQLFSLLTGNAVKATRVRLGGAGLPALYYLRSNYRNEIPDPGEGRLHPFQMFLSRVDLENYVFSPSREDGIPLPRETDMSTIFQRWIDFSDDYRGPLNLFFRTVSVAHVAQMDFFSLAAIADAFLSGLYGRSDKGGPSYAAKMRTFLDGLEPGIQRLVLGAETKDSVIKNIKNQRNYWAHLGDIRKSLHTQDVVYFASHLRALVYMTIIAEYMKIPALAIESREMYFRNCWAHKKRPIITRPDHRK